MFLSKMYLAQDKGDIMKYGELWYISTDVHFTVMSNLNLYRRIDFSGPNSEFEGQNQCGTSKSTVWAHQYG